MMLEVDSWPRGGSDVLGGGAQRTGTASPSLTVYLILRSLVKEKPHQGTVLTHPRRKQRPGHGKSYLG